MEMEVNGPGGTQVTDALLHPTGARVRIGAEIRIEIGAVLGKIVSMGNKTSLQKETRSNVFQD
jgi:hypothetical protein